MTGRDVGDDGEAVVRVVPMRADAGDTVLGTLAVADPRPRPGVDPDGRTDAPADARADAFVHLARLHLEASYRLARAILGNVAEAEDATHDAFVQAWRRWPTLRDPLRFEAWFDRILLNTCRDRLRRQRRWPVVDISEELHDRRLDPGIEAIDDRDLIGAALRRMAPDDRLILALRYYLDLSVDDIARRLGIRPGTAKSRLHYALRRLNSTLDDHDTGGLR